MGTDLEGENSLYGYGLVEQLKTWNPSNFLDHGSSLLTHCLQVWMVGEGGVHNKAIVKTEISRMQYINHTQSATELAASNIYTVNKCLLCKFYWLPIL